MAYDPRGTSADPQPEPRRRRGPHIGPIAITPVRVFLPIALIGSIAYVAYTVTVRDTSQIPALALGAGLLGVVFVGLSLAGVAETIRAGRRGQAGRSVIAAVFGGIAGVIALGCFAGAMLMQMLTQTPRVP